MINQIDALSPLSINKSLCLLKTLFKTPLTDIINTNFVTLTNMAEILGKQVGPVAYGLMGKRIPIEERGKKLTMYKALPGVPIQLL